MKIGIIIHSYTGNTLGVAQQLQDTLTAEGHYVELKRVEAYNEDPSAASNIQLKSIPDIRDYDGIIFGAPVRAFSLSPVMKEYLLQLSTLSEKRVGCFVTEYFPFPWMGGSRAIKMMKEICERKDGRISGTGTVNWSRRDRERRIKDVIQKVRSF